MDWFEKLTGFKEASYEETRSLLKVEGGQLKSLVDGAAYRTGDLELVSLAELRQRAAAAVNARGSLKVRTIEGDVRELHRNPKHSGPLFQVASLSVFTVFWTVDVVNQESLCSIWS